MASHPKKIPNRPKFENMLVFGYSCKYFRDDEKARFVDEGKHLIRHVGDETLTIDRYYARAALSELTGVEASSGADVCGLTDSEKEVELLCDEERYRALKTNDDEENMYIEEELKRVERSVRERYGQVGYLYEQESNVKEEKEVVVVKEEKPFVLSPLLDIPVDMTLPSTEQQNALIEKTAAFVSVEGPQMEIFLKMKQVGNPLFDFLSFDHALHSYYRLVLRNIKTGRYLPQSGQSTEDPGSEGDDNYLHPSLISLTIPKINYKPSENCAYSMLVNNLKDKAALHVSSQETIQHKTHCEGKSLLGPADNNDSSAALTSLRNDCRKLDEVTKKTDLVSSPKATLDSSSATIAIPPSDLQIIIDKTASYSAKNGRAFETIVKEKNDSRFKFLHPSDVHHSYYKYKFKLYTRLEQKRVARGKENIDLLKDMSTDNHEEKSESQLKEACFSIKSNKVDSKTDESAVKAVDFPMNESSQEDQSKTKLAPVCFSLRPREVENVIIDKNVLPVDGDDSLEETLEEKPALDLKSAAKLGENSENKIEKYRKCWKADRKKDRRTPATRVTSITKERQIQQERKKKVAAFLQSLRGPSNVESNQRFTEASDSESNVTSIPYPNYTTDFNEKTKLDSLVGLPKSETSDCQTPSASSLDLDKGTNLEIEGSSDDPTNESYKSKKKCKKRKHKSKSHEKRSSIDLDEGGIEEVDDDLAKSEATHCEDSSRRSRKSRSEKKTKKEKHMPKSRRHHSKTFKKDHSDSE